MAAALSVLCPPEERHRPEVRAALVLVAGALVDLRSVGILARGFLTRST